MILTNNINIIKKKFASYCKVRAKFCTSNDLDMHGQSTKQPLVTIFVLSQPAMYGLNIQYHDFKFDSTQPYFMLYCLESLPQPFFNWRWPYLNPRPSKYQSNALPIELS